MFAVSEEDSSVQLCRSASSRLTLSRHLHFNFHISSGRTLHMCPRLAFSGCEDWAPSGLLRSASAWEIFQWFAGMYCTDVTSVSTQLSQHERVVCAV